MILITGGSGKIGATLVEHYATKGFGVVTTVRDTRKLFDAKPLLKNNPNLVSIESNFLQRTAQRL
jgi:short-subunit dehydrogenase